MPPQKSMIYKGKMRFEKVNGAKRGIGHAPSKVVDI